MSFLESFISIYPFSIIRIHKPPDGGIIVSTLEVIQLRLCIVVIATVAEGVNMRDVLGVGEFNAAGIAVGVGSFYNQYTKFIKICQ